MSKLPYRHRVAAGAYDVSETERRDVAGAVVLRTWNYAGATGNPKGNEGLTNLRSIIFFSFFDDAQRLYFGRRPEPSAVITSPRFGFYH